MRASLPLAFLSLFIRTLSLYPTGQVHFRKINSARSGFAGHWLQHRESFRDAYKVQGKRSATPLSIAYDRLALHESAVVAPLCRRTPKTGAVSLVHGSDSEVAATDEAR